MLWTLRRWEKIKIIEAEVCLIEILPELAISSFMGYLKGKKHKKFLELKYKYRN